MHGHGMAPHASRGGRRLSTMLTVAAATTYLGSVSVGTLRLRGHRVPRAWHARLFIGTAATTAIAALSAVRVNGRLTLLLAAAVAPLSLLPWLTAPVRTHTRLHVVLALAAAPWYVAALCVSGRRPSTPNRRT